MTSDAQTTRVHTARSAASFWVMGDEVTMRAALPGTTLHVIDVMVPPGSGTPPHNHASAEIFRVLSGNLKIWALLDGAPREFDAAPGDVVTIPSNAPHGYRNVGDEPARFTAIVDDQMIGFFEAAASSEAPSGPPTDAMIARIMGLTAAHGINVLVPA